jgi:hypothetical protein
LCNKHSYEKHLLGNYYCQISRYPGAPMTRDHDLCPLSLLPSYPLQWSASVSKQWTPPGGGLYRVENKSVKCKLKFSPNHANGKIESVPMNLQMLTYLI